jgi:uncharacterized protein
MIVFHVAMTCADDYVARREPHRHAHIARLDALRARGLLVGGGPAPDGRSADLVYRLPQPDDLKRIVEEDPYWVAGAWTSYVPRSFTEFVEPWELVPIILDGSRAATIVEGRTREHDMAQFALIELRGAGRLAFGGFFEHGDTWTLMKTPEAATALTWLEETGFWTTEALRARPFLYVL